MTGTNSMHISLDAVRSIQLAAQGLLAPFPGPATKSDVLAVIRQMGALQIDTINVVARSPYLVLWSRLGDYQPVWLEQLLEERAIFEYWAHAACFLPIEDFPLFRNWMKDGHRGWVDSRRWIEQHAEVVDRILGHIREHGPVRSATFERSDGQASGWWNWKEEKIALEQLFNVGDLMIVRRHNFQRVYDLAERVMPNWNEADSIPYEETFREFIIKTVRCLGIALPAWIPDYFRLSKTVTRSTLQELVRDGTLVEVTVEGWEATPALVLPADLPLVEEAAAGRLSPSLTTLLSPFDPLIWDRARVKALFGFDYMIECYTPAPKRIYGYFSLPILHKGRLVGRLDAKAYRKEKIFEVRSVHLEPGITADDELAQDLVGAISRCAGWHGASQVLIRQANPAELLRLLEREIRQVS